MAAPSAPSARRAKAVESFKTAADCIGTIEPGHSLFAITRDFDMQTQPHLLLLQKTMVMVEGLATSLDPQINMWDVSGPFVKGWIRDDGAIRGHVERA